ncbi:hypothetical protein [Borreliella bavariensis]|uniref:hypothetical protein n=1 Tax=Borreliella bavariensis TaxID=664662 RepID=UPI001C002438|nr:hypothetical protein [Borreliella bavariensis]
MYILLLVTIFFLSCKFLGKKSTSKEKEDASLPDSASKISKLKTATSSGKQEKNINNATGEAAAQGAKQM